ncbi:MULTISPECIES: hypothetical protein [unclassified Leucobacter]|uniref:hypothetical protein n=1 Tax=unclassified Leucobacter TaxID=2621730 RepID=UPI00165E8984|nr:MULTISPECIES: hypothetical protein [unclassified Leucobacter]MBC9926373.1 hypothetical protein [Leucobacter sp. cx-169]MBC9936923.1 hypothetical protein [Leucobacter sp. cx-87]
MESLDIATVAADTSDPRAGLRAIASLRALTERLELAQVEAGLSAGMNWQGIAEALGVSRQAAHKKFARKVNPSIAAGGRAR